MTIPTGAPPTLSKPQKNSSEGSEDSKWLSAISADLAWKSTELFEILADLAWISDRVPEISKDLFEFSAGLAWISDRVPEISNDLFEISAGLAWISDHVPEISKDPACDSEVSLDIIHPPTRIVPRGVPTRMSPREHRLAVRTAERDHRAQQEERILSSIREQIEEALSAIEREEQCIVCLAVESGSRAWGFESTDSDYDVRFIYVRPVDWYLSIDADSKRDVIEKPITGDLDVSGWDLRKALQLLRKSNPPLLEWLQSPIIYREHGEVADGLRALASDFYSARATFFHYLHMAQGNLREYLRGDVVWRKKYFYVLRPLLAMRWIEEKRGLVPIEFDKLMATIPVGDLRDAVDELLAAKRAGAELDRGPRVPLISDFVESEIERFERIAAVQPVSAGDSSRLDLFFRQVVTTARIPAGPA